MLSRRLNRSKSCQRLIKGALPGDPGCVRVWDSAAIARIDSLIDVVGPRARELGDEQAHANEFTLGNHLIANIVQSIADATMLAERPEVLSD
ncbi:hypothetical protein EEB13_15335 [Rhodococcus sp. WS3]|nr:hypothetical protein EEB13_15335 [Rhodococcus sp. WS3]